MLCIEFGIGAAIKNYRSGIDAVSYLRTASTVMSPRFLHEIFTNLQVSGLVFFAFVGLMIWYYFLCQNPSIWPPGSRKKTSPVIWSSSIPPPQ
jgi:hypothetical protein